MSHESRFANFSEDGTWKSPSTEVTVGHDNLLHRPLILVTHDESTFHSNDGRKKAWREKGKPKLKAKGRGRGIMASAFLTPGGILRVPDHITNEELFSTPNWPFDADRKPLREAVHLFEFGGEEWWTADKMIEQTLSVAVPVTEVHDT